MNKSEPNDRASWPHYASPNRDYSAQERSSHEPGKAAGEEQIAPAVKKNPDRARAVSNSHAPPTQARTPVRKPHPSGTQGKPPPTGRDPFPYVIAAFVGLIIVGLAVAAFLVGSIVSQPQAVSLPSQPNPDAASKPGTVDPSTVGDSLPGVAVPSEGQTHAPEGQAITYQNYPPSSGTHYASTADYGFSEKEIPEGKLVHNLEHGAIVLYYEPDLSSAVLQSLREAATKLPTEKYGKVKIVIVPYSKLQTSMAIVAWGRVETLDSFDYDKVSTFYEAMVDHGPEDVP